MSIENNRLRDLFKQLKKEKVSEEFNSKLMLKVNGLARVNAQKRRIKDRFFIILAILGGVAGILILTWGIFYYYGLELNIPQLSTASIKASICKVKLHLTATMLAIAVLLLLVVDMLIRKHRLGKV